jgi:formylglycine-generating enzyme required for sulfatase activity
LAAFSRWFFTRESSVSVHELSHGPPFIRNQDEIVEVEIAMGVRMRFCWIPPGEVQLGSPDEEYGRGSAEDEVVCGRFRTRGFYMGKYSVTQKQWQAVMGNNPSHFVPSEETIMKDGIDDTSGFPVESVSWSDCHDFLRKLNDTVKLPETMAGGKCGLPHEDEWEYACRGGKGNKQPFYFGPELNGKQANCAGKYPYGTDEKGPDEGRTTAVGSYEAIAPHPWGLCDMHGNVWQWCESLPFRDPAIRVIRGGSWFTPPLACRAAVKNGIRASERRKTVGLRVVVHLN